ncbi:putative dNMP kinase [Thermus phage G20c]|nr:putative dNMP kinase [Thermus phage G20c]
MRVWVGLTGYARVGKDTVALMLEELEPRFKRASLGNIIKRSADPVLREYLGISAFTEDPREKEIIRDFLVWHGYHRYDEFLEAFKRECEPHPFLVNTRVFDLREAKWWVESGGVIVEITRPGVEAAEPREAENLSRLKAHGLIHATLVNDGTLTDLKAKVRDLWSNLKEGAHVLKLV